MAKEVLKLCSNSQFKNGARKLLKILKHFLSDFHQEKMDIEVKHLRFLNRKNLILRHNRSQSNW